MAASPSRRSTTTTGSGGRDRGNVDPVVPRKLPYQWRMPFGRPAAGTTAAGSAPAGTAAAESVRGADRRRRGRSRPRPGLAARGATAGGPGDGAARLDRGRCRTRSGRCPTRPAPPRGSGRRRSTGVPRGGTRTRGRRRSPTVISGCADGDRAHRPAVQCDHPYPRTGRARPRRPWRSPPRPRAGRSRPCHRPRPATR